jgi:hypothetical protein
MADVDVVPIADDDNLLRRIRPDQIIDDKNLGTRRPSSGAFKDPEMSVDSECLLHRHGLDWTFSLRNHTEYSLARFAAAAARTKGLTVLHKPERDNPAHTEVTGKKTQGVSNHLVAQSTWAYLKPR